MTINESRSVGDPSVATTPDRPRRMAPRPGGAVRPGYGGHRARRGRVGVSLHGAPLAGRRRAQAVAQSILISPRDPHFAVKAARVLDLYQRVVPIPPT